VELRFDQALSRVADGGHKMMHSLAPPKQKRAPAKSAFRKLQLRGAYHALNLVQLAFGFVFWKIEQAKAHIDVEQERRRT